MFTVTLRPPYPRERIPVFIDLEAGCTLWTVCTYLGMRESPVSTGIRIPMRPARGVVSVSTVLPWRLNMLQARNRAPFLRVTKIFRVVTSRLDLVHFCRTQRSLCSLRAVIFQHSLSLGLSIKFRTKLKLRL